MTIKKLFMIIICALVVLSTVVGVEFVNLTGAVEAQREALEYRHRALMLSIEMANDSAGLTNDIRLYGATGDTAYRDHYMFILDSSAGKVPREDGETISFDKKVELLGVTDREQKALLNAKKLSDGLAVIEVEVMDTIDAYVKKHGDKSSYVENMDEALYAQLLRLYDDDYYVWIDKIGGEVARFNELLFERIDDNIASTSATTQTLANAFFITLLVLVFSTLGLILYALHFLNTRLGGPPSELAAIAEAIAGGDLDVTLKIKEGDTNSLFVSIGRMVDTLRANINEISHKTEEAESKTIAAEKAMLQAQEAKQAADRAKAEGLLDAAKRLSSIVLSVSDVGQKIGSQAHEIRTGTEQQSSRVLSTVTAMEEMTATVLEVAKNSSTAAEVCQEAQVNAREGMEVVQKSVDAMETTRTQAEELKDDMSQLGQQAESIGQIMNVITDIADQTNLLALNAAIEAARAGEAGRGFAVVADEVRKLAEKTMTATKEVGDAISAIQNSTRSNIQSMDKAVGDIVSVSELTSLSGEALQGIIANVELSASQVQEIATAVEQQSATSEEINASLGDINRITEENSQEVAQTVEALHELTGLIDELSKMISELEREGQQ